MSSASSSDFDMTFRHDSLLEAQVKKEISDLLDDHSSPLSSLPPYTASELQNSVPTLSNIPSSPLSSLPSDPDDQPVPEGLRDLATNTDLEVLSTAGASSSSSEDSEDAGSDDVFSAASINMNDYVRRSDRKRKAPSFYNHEIGLDANLNATALDKPHKKSKKDASLQEADTRASSTSPWESQMATPTQHEQSLIVKLKISPRGSDESSPQRPHVTASLTTSEAAGTKSSTESSQGSHSQITSKHSGVDESVLMALSKALTHKLPIEEKPLPQGQPEIWADNRHELCESLPGLYEAYNSSFYGKNRIARCFMLDGNSHVRDLIDENVVILRAGGSLEKDPATGKMEQISDQEINNQILAVKNSIAQQSPIGLICGDKNTMPPSKMPHKYNSMDWYKATHVWAEQDYSRYRGLMSWKKIYKYRLEKLDCNTKGWWVPKDAVTLVELGSLGPPAKQQCSSCQEHSEQLYLSSWMCLNPACDMHWCLLDGSKPDNATLHYDPRFLKQKTSWVNEQPAQSFLFPLHVASPIAGEDYKRENRYGMTCPHCGKCNSRLKWDGWECTNCGFEHKPAINVVPAAAVQDARRPVTNGYANSHDSPSEGVGVDISMKFAYNYRWASYKFQVSETEVAEVIHGIANKVVREEPQGPNDMWEDLQVNCMDLERRKLSHGHMNSFTMNYGMPYKFVAAGQSLPFTAAPWPITETVSRLNWADKVSSDLEVSEADKFNELYIVGYFENMKMDWHDDGEEGLGSTVATLSLGAPAEMNFRPKRTYYHGVKRISRNKQSFNVMTMDDPLPGFPLYEERKAYIKEIKEANLSKEDQENKLAELATKFGYGPGTKSSMPNVKEWLKLWLAHGDIIIMRGSQFQKFFEHQVVPKGIMRYALTCRTILPGHLKKSELPDYEVEPDQGNYDGSRIV